MLRNALAPAVAVLLTASPALAGESTASREVHRTVALDADGRVSLDTYKGSIRVSSWDRPQAEVTARVEADGSCGHTRYQAELVRDTDVSIEGEGRSLRIRSDYDRVKDRSVWHFFSLCSSLPFVHYTISMPRTARLEVKDYKSEIHVSDLASEVRLSTYKGDVRLSGLSGSLELDTYKGDVRAAFLKLSGDSRLDTYKGDIQISLPRDARFAVSADVGRRARFDSDFPVLWKSGSRRGRGDRAAGAVNGGGPELSLKTYRGSFRLRSS